eukprot:9467035-Pyramimonas_sp.AAC.1
MPTFRFNPCCAQPWPWSRIVRSVFRRRGERGIRPPSAYCAGPSPGRGRHPMPLPLLALGPAR